MAIHCVVDAEKKVRLDFLLIIFWILTEFTLNNFIVLDRYYLKVNETSWHEECLKCTYCSVSLFSEETCFIKSNKIMCKIDYYK